MLTSASGKKKNKKKHTEMTDIPALPPLFSSSAEVGFKDQASQELTATRVWPLERGQPEKGESAPLHEAATCPKDLRMIGAVAGGDSCVCLVGTHGSLGNEMTYTLHSG